jgi:hypothetical protein
MLSQLLQLNSAAEDAWVWDLIEIAPVPATACKLTRGRIERVLKRYRHVISLLHGF